MNNTKLTLWLSNKWNLIVIIMMVSLMATKCIARECECEEPANVWFKVSNDVNHSNYGQIVVLDMSNGYAYTDGVSIHLILTDIDTKEQVMLTFPIGRWVVDGKDEIQKEFDSLEEYLKSNQDKSIEIKNQ